MVRILERGSSVAFTALGTRVDCSLPAARSAFRRLGSVRDPSSSSQNFFTAPLTFSPRLGVAGGAGDCPAGVGPAGGPPPAGPPAGAGTESPRPRAPAVRLRGKFLRLAGAQASSLAPDSCRPTGASLPCARLPRTQLSF